jgi:hypothetical protein
MPNPIGRRLDASYPPDDDENNLCTVDASPHPDPSESPGATGACDTAPDYTTLTLGFSMLGAANASVTVDRYGQDYFSLGLGVATPGWGSSSMAGYLRSDDHPCDPPSPDVLANHLTGASVSTMAGAGVAAGLTVSSAGTARETGMATPQAGEMFQVGARVH